MALTAALRARGVPKGDSIFTAERAALVEALGDLEPDAFTGDFEADQVKWALGEQGNIWPDTILGDVRHRSILVGH